MPAGKIRNSLVFEAFENLAFFWVIVPKNLTVPNFRLPL
jgi:hypothetical protein